MFKKNILIVLTFQCLCAGAFAQYSIASDELNSKLDTRLHDYSLHAENFIGGLTSFAGQFAIPIGIEWVSTPEASTPLNFSWKDVTVREVLETIVQSQRGYEVQFRNGVVHVSSKRISPDQNFLLLKINAFDANHQPVEVVSRNLSNQVRLIVSPPKRQTGGVGGSIGSNIDEPNIDVRLNDASVEDILDSLVIASARKMWIVTFSDSFILTPTGYRRTSPLWNNSPIPDDEQPAWELLHWKDPVSSHSLEAK
jgi:hypothetical protein